MSQQIEIISPFELQKEACIACGFEKPESKVQWMQCVNYWAFNVESGLEVEICQLLAIILDCPLEQRDLRDIALYQMGVKAGFERAIQTIEERPLSYGQEDEGGTKH